MNNNVFPINGKTNLKHNTVGSEEIEPLIFKGGQ